LGSLFFVAVPWKFTNGREGKLNGKYNAKGRKKEGKTEAMKLTQRKGAKRKRLLSNPCMMSLKDAL
jgi:hypothetical protein